MSKCLDYQGSHFLQKNVSCLWNCFKKGFTIPSPLFKSTFNSQLYPSGPERCNFYKPNIPNEKDSVELLTRFPTFDELRSSLTLSKITLMISRG